MFNQYDKQKIKAKVKKRKGNKDQGILASTLSEVWFGKKNKNILLKKKQKKNVKMYKCMNCFLCYFIYCEVKILFNYVGSLIINK